MKLILTILVLTLFSTSILAENGYDLWLRYVPIDDLTLANSYRSSLTQLIISATSDTLKAAQGEFDRGTQGLLQTQLPVVSSVTQDGAIWISTSSSLAGMTIEGLSIEEFDDIGQEGYLIKTAQVDQKSCIIIAGNTDIGTLYGVFNFLKLLQTHQAITNLQINEVPQIQHRILDHWDNIDGTIERGYGGYSLWDWQRLPGFIDPRYIDYARADASIGINGAVLNNVNAQTPSLTEPYLAKTAVLADVFRPYGVKVYLTPRFDAPMKIGGLKTADPLDPSVIGFWKDLASKVYSYIPDFGGFLLKADSEGQPGPQTYNRTHVDGANMLAGALAPYGGIVMWRTFEYEIDNEDRAKQSYEEFIPFDGKFAANVLLQAKNGPIDFQPREPFHPLFGAMPKTPLMLEFQVTQEYLGFAVQLVYLAPLFKETLDSDTYSKGKGSTVAKVIEGKVDGHSISGIAGVSNVGSDACWTGHPFAQANWYAFGSLAWNPDRTADAIADEWLKMTFTNDETFVTPVKEMMMNSRENAVNYMTPLGLNNIMNFDTHYGPGPWDVFGPWRGEDYHKADSIGIGYDRTSNGSNVTGQYFSPLRETLDNITTVPEQFLLWFHHVPWTYPMSSGHSLWEELVYHYYDGVDAVGQMRDTWAQVEGKIDDERFGVVTQLLAEHEREADWWRGACVLYFQTFSKLSLPTDLTPPKYDLSHYQNISFPDRDIETSNYRDELLVIY